MLLYDLCRALRAHPVLLRRAPVLQERAPLAENPCIRKASEPVLLGLG